MTASLEVAERDGPAALGEYEPGVAGYMPRLAPPLLLARTRTFGSWGCRSRAIPRSPTPPRRPASWGEADARLADEHTRRAADVRKRLAAYEA
jgi:hypothetical protein